VRVIDGENNEQLGVLPLTDALNMARNRGVDLVEIAPNANPPVCKIIDFGKYRYEQAKKDKDAKKHQHAGKVKEIQLSPTIDPHDFSVKLQHAIDFLSEEMKVKVTLRFRGREMAHKEYGFQQVNNFIKAIAPWGNPDAQPKLIGKGINVMISPLPRNKRAKNPKESEEPLEEEVEVEAEESEKAKPAAGKKKVSTNAAENPENGGINSPFSQLDSVKQ
jgi:translation initiation factor IF-3